MEKHELLPENQHGFRAKRSTMAAHTAMQNEWVRNTEERKNRCPTVGTVHSI
jgi:hypothetical protein